MGESTDKSEISRQVKFSEAMYDEIKAYTRRHPPLTITQAVKRLVAMGLHASKFDPREYLSTHNIDDEGG